MDLQEALDSRLLQTWINPELLDGNVINDLRSQFQEASPFPHLHIDNLILEDKFEEVAEELSQQEFEIKESDLFQLAQTADFDELDSNILLEFKGLFRSEEFLTIMQSITDIPLSDDVDCLGNIYKDTDYLLCHDDKLIKRKIAYILYFTDLFEEDGGGLHLFDSMDNLPHKIVKKIYPRYNRLTFFKVTRQSFHEVGEILNPEIYRVSISGWFNNGN